MNRRFNIFTKIVVLILLLLFPVIGLYTFSNQVSVSVVEEAIQTTNFNKMAFLVNQMDGQIDRLSTNAILFANDPMTQQFQFEQMSGNTMERLKTVGIIQDHINLQSEASSWNTDISIYFRSARQVISTLRDIFEYDESSLPKQAPSGWQYTGMDGKAGSSSFVWYAYYPFSAYNQPEEAKIVVRTSFAAVNLEHLLDEYKADGQGDPFLYNRKFGLIANRTVKADDVQELEQYLNSKPMLDVQTGEEVSLHGKQYMLSYMRSQRLGWYLVDYLPMQDVLAPITKSSNLFYGSTFLLLFISVFASFILYRNVQVPIRRLVLGLQKIKRGDYTARIQDPSGSDFVFLFYRFNEMAQQIQELVGKVHVEQIRSREAMLKQLQSQINPHFLYNCLYFIKNVAKLGDIDAVVAMALNLGDYFRYTTRLVNQTAVLREEIEVIVNYLTIQNLRMERIIHVIDIPKEMEGLVIPRLFLQPIVENAIIHGIEPKEGIGSISITGMRKQDGCHIVIEDNGCGMEPEALAVLQSKIRQSEEEENASCGLWNVNKRLVLMYGKDSGLYLSKSPKGGLRVDATFRMTEVKLDVPTDDRG